MAAGAVIHLQKATARVEDKDRVTGTIEQRTKLDGGADERLFGLDLRETPAARFDSIRKVACQLTEQPKFFRVKGVAFLGVDG